MGTEFMAQAQEDLARAKLEPFDGGRIADQFSHGINSHLPEGVSTSVDPSRYYTDEDCHLVIDQIPGVSAPQFK